MGPIVSHALADRQTVPRQTAHAGRTMDAALHSTGAIDAAIEGTPRGRFLLELYSNSAVFPIAIILLEVLLEGGPRYFLQPDFYAIAAGAVAQAGYLARVPETAGWRRMMGNLVAPAIYTAFETATEGLRFFLIPHHLAYWAFALAIGMLQGLRARRDGRIAEAFLVVENVVRSMFLFVVYAAFEWMSASPSTRAFFADPSHVFMAWAIALLGLLGGVAAVTSHRYMGLLRTLSRQLRQYSEWLFGRSLLEEAMADPGRFALKRGERAILFMDVRAFTAWSETQPPEAVVAVLNRYYEAAEGVFARHAPIRFKLSADEVMAVFVDAHVAVEAARGLAREVRERLAPDGLGAGIGLHWGPVVEGLMGASATKNFDVIGDTVNTAKRIEGAAGPGEVLMSDAFCEAAGIPPRAGRAIAVKGKSRQLDVHPDPMPLTAIKPQEQPRAVT